MFNIGDLMGGASKIKDEVKRIRDSLGDKTVEGSAGGGMVKVVANGKSQIVSVKLDPEMMKMNDLGMLEDLVRAGVNEALRNSQNLMKEEMGKLADGFGPLGSFLKGFGN